MDIEYFNTTSEECEVIYPDGTSDYIAKDDLGGVRVILLKVSIFGKKVIFA